MKIKKLFIVFLCVFVLQSCGSKKRKSTSSKSTKVEKKESDIKRKKQPEKVVKIKEVKSTSSKKDILKGDVKQQYIDKYKHIAMSEMRDYKIPASITLAQGLLESSAGRSQLSAKSNNHFGIKCHKGWKGKRVYHDDDAKGECFRKYKDPSYSFRDHSLFLSERKRYSFLFEFSAYDYQAWAKGLRKAGYATDKRYPQKLITLIENYQLYKFDKQVLGGNYVAPIKTKIHIVKKGDTLYSLSKLYAISVQELKDFNNLVSNTISIGQKLIVSSK